MLTREDFLKPFDFQKALKPVSLFDGIIIAPVFEELIFRGMILMGITRRWGSSWGLAVSAIIFGLIHLDGLSPQRVISGLAWGVLVLHYQNIWVSVVLHCINNIFAVGLQALATLDSGPTTEDDLDLLTEGIVHWSFLAIGILLTVCAAPFWIRRFLHFSGARQI